MHGVFVTGTDPDVGKTVVAAWLVARLGASYGTPVQAGTDPETDSDTVFRLDHVMLVSGVAVSGEVTWAGDGSVVSHLDVRAPRGVRAVIARRSRWRGGWSPWEC